MEQLHREIEDIEEIYTDLRGLKHDMRSHLNNIMQYVKGVGNGDTREIDEYIVAIFRFLTYNYIESGIEAS